MPSTAWSPSTPRFPSSRDPSLAHLAARAFTLDERRAAWRRAGRPGFPGAPPASPLLASWTKALGTDPAFTARRLAWDGWDPEELAAVAAWEPELPPGEPLPGWVEMHARALAEVPALAAEVEQNGEPEESAWFAPGRALPFFELFLPHLRAAKKALSVACVSSSSLLSPAAARALELRLLHDAVALAISTFYARFDTARALGRLLGPPPPGGFYRAFVSALLAGGLAECLAEHPGLARGLGQLALTWVEVWAEFLTRLEADLPRLKATFGGSPGRVEVLETALSDRHRGGRQVAGVTFTSGLRLIYKPRPLDQETAWNELLHWLGARGLEEPPRALAVLARPGYGWVERVEPAPAPDASAAARSFRQAGVLLALADLLRADDLHAENVIATDRGPVLVDLETLFQPSADTEGDAWDRSCLRSQLLTNPRLDAGGNRCDDGGFSPSGGETRERGRRFWKGVGTDELSFELRDVVAPPGTNRVELGGELLHPRAYGGELRTGYAAGYRLVLRERVALCAPDSPLAPFREAETRLLLRPSNVYGTLLAQLAAPRYQEHPLLGSLLIDSVNRAFHGEAQVPRLWPLVALERRALGERDIPLFTIPITSTALPADGAWVEGAYARSGWEAVRGRLAALSEADLAERLRELEAALPPSLPQRRAGSTRPSTLPERLFAQALAAGDALLAHPAPAPRTAADLGLYNGLAGRSITLAALAALTSEEPFRRAALTCRDAIGEALAGRGGAHLGAGLSPGMARGWGGLLYAAGLLARLLGEREALAPLLLPGLERAAANPDAKAEVADGTAGALLALLALDDAERRARPVTNELARALSCHQPSAAGLAHGAAGIALALRRAAGLLEKPELRAAAEASNTFERSVFSQEAGNWPVSGVTAGAEKKPVFMVAWCHGAVGVGLGRIGELEAGADGLARADLGAAVKTVAAAPEAPVDHLCCGNLGRLELLLEAGLRLGKAGLVERAQGAAAQGLLRVEREGGFRLDPVTADSDANAPWGFFRGLAGITYQLLRLAQPEALPSVLRFGR